MTALSTFVRMNQPVQESITQGKQDDDRQMELHEIRALAYPGGGWFR